MTEGTVTNDREEAHNARDHANVYTRRVGGFRLDIEDLPDPWADVPTPVHHEPVFDAEPPF